MLCILDDNLLHFDPHTTQPPLNAELQGALSVRAWRQHATHTIPMQGPPAKELLLYSTHILVSLSNYAH
jgi:hypothetical protein